MFMRRFFFALAFVRSESSSAMRPSAASLPRRDNIRLDAGKQLIARASKRKRRRARIKPERRCAGR